MIGAAAALAVAALVWSIRPGFGRLPRGERLERIRQSPNFRDGKFRNRHFTALMTSDRGRLRAMWDFLFADRTGRVPESPVPALKTDLKQLSPTFDGLVWFGHSSYLL